MWSGHKIAEPPHGKVTVVQFVQGLTQTLEENFHRVFPAPWDHPHAALVRVNTTRITLSKREEMSQALRYHSAEEYDTRDGNVGPGNRNGKIKAGMHELQRRSSG